MIRALVNSILFAAACAPSVGGLPVEQYPAAEETAVRTQALADRGQYEQAEALARARVNLLLDAHASDSLEIAQASELLVHMLLLNGKGAAAATLALAEQTLKAKETHLGREHPDLAPSLLNVGEALLVATADYQRAIASIQRAVALREQHAGLRSVALAESLDVLGIALASAGRNDDALRELERSLRLKEATLDGSDVAVARTLELMGWARQRRGDYDQARAPILRALAIREAADVAHPAYAEILNRLALQLFFEGNLVESRDTSKRAVAVAERTLRADHPTVARSLDYLAGTLMYLGDLVEARSVFERVLSIAERTFGPSHFQTSDYVNDLAVAELFLGAYPAARALFERSLKIHEAQLGPWDGRVATTVNNIADVDARLGDYASARREHARAISIWERVLGRDHPFVARALMNLATVHREQGARLEALPLLERALAIRERALGPSHRDVATTLADLAATLMQLGRRDRAQSVAARAVDIWERAAAPEAPEFAAVLGVYADLQAARGEAGAARLFYSRALAIEEKVLTRSHPAFANTQARLALALANLGETTLALETAMSAEATGREHLRLMLRYLPERQSLNFAAIRPRGVDLALSLIGRVSEAPSAGLDVVIRGRALVLDEMAARRGDLQATDQDTIRLRNELASARQRLANLLVRGPGDLEPKHFTALVDDTRLESERAERALAEQSAAFRQELNREQLGVDRVAASVPDGAALVSFVRYNRTFFSTTPQKPAPNPPARASSRAVPSYLAFVLRPHQPPVAIPLGAASAIDSRVARWREDIAVEGANPARAPALTTGGSSRDSGAALRQLVWDPVAAHLHGAQQIFIVPDGTLSLVPFAALPVGRTAYLLEQTAPIHYLSTERDLAMAPVESTQITHGLLALGGPAFDAGEVRPAINRRGPASTAAKATPAVRAARPGCGNLDAIRFQPLGGTLQEVKEVATLWGGRPGMSVPDPAHVLAGPGASERAFKEQAPGHRVLHLATHGFFLDNGCAPVPAGVRGVGGVVTSGRQSPRQAENPLLLSGLALAGANRRQSAGPDEDDGILTAGEVATLNLEGVEWAVLSACDTGVGQVTAGEGVIGLRRAFQIAGARTVIMSLWSVDDQAARTWMHALYEGRLHKRLTTIEAVHAANLATLRTRRARGQSTHPFYWAAFVAVGDWK